MIKFLFTLQALHQQPELGEWHRNYKVVIMMESNSETGQSDIQLWQFVLIEDYILPAAPVTHTVKKGVAGFRRLFSQQDDEITSPLKSGDELRLLPDWQ